MARLRIRVRLWLPLLQLFFSVLHLGASGKPIPTTLDGPFSPVTVPLDERIRGQASDLPADDPRVQRPVTGTLPEQISVSLSTPDSMWVSWITGEFQIGDHVCPRDASSVPSVVNYGILEDNLSYEATGYSLVYSQLYPFAGLQNYTSGIIHHVRLTGLRESTIYYYRCGDPHQNAMSEVLSFRTMPAPGPSRFPGRIAIIGDLGLTYNTTSTIDHVRKNDPDLILLVGDVSYANLYLTNGTGSTCYSCSFPDSPIHETYQPRWDYWGRSIVATRRIYGGFTCISLDGFKRSRLYRWPTWLEAAENKIRESRKEVPDLARVDVEDCCVQRSLKRCRRGGLHCCVHRSLKSRKLWRSVALLHKSSNREATSLVECLRV